MRNAFGEYHPLVNFIFFISVIGFSMFVMNPVCLFISLLSSLIYSVYLNGKKAVSFSCRFMAPLILITLIVNPIFNHEGVTILRFLPGGNPLTLESIIYAAAAALLMVSVIEWFSCVNTIMTSDKFIYLFGRIIPSLSLVLSMTLRFVPRFMKQMKNVCAVQSTIGRGISSGGILTRIKNAVRIISIMITWSLENSIETSDSMRSRGYGVASRSAYTNYKFRRRDALLLSAVLFFGAYFAVGIMTGAISWRYFPSFSIKLPGLYGTSVYLAYLCLCFIPLTVTQTEERKWKSIRSKI